MKRIKILSLLLCLSMLCAMFTPGTLAQEDEAPDNGMKVSKTATANGDGTYTVTLEAYATGSKVISEVTEEVPTDVVLVLDLSSSMDNQIGTVTYSAYSNRNNEALYALRHNGGEGNLWYKTEDNSYHSVSVTAEGRTPNYTDASSYTNSNLYTNRENLYAKIGEEYFKATVTRSGLLTYPYTYTYNGKTVSSTGANARPTFTDGVTLHVPIGVNTANAVYTYTYTDYTASTGTKTIITSTGGTTVPTGAMFYSRSTSISGGGKRLEALKAACNTFADEVAKKAMGADGTDGTEDDINHRVAIVGFNSSSRLYTGSSAATALQDMNTTAGQNTVRSAIPNLGTGQGTVPATGLTVANQIFSAYPIAEGETRQRVVIFFTDGYPSTTGADNFTMSLATDAIAQAATAKNTYKATVYAVAVIAGADPTSAGNQNGTNPEKVNWYLHAVSSNKDGKPQTPSYYLSAADAASLKNIFKQISQQIETGGSESTLTQEAVVRDIVSPYFTLPDGTTAADITLKTYACTGKDNSGNYTWSENAIVMGVAATIDKETDPETGLDLNRVNVTGFNFSENYVGTVTENGRTTYRGHKLVISFKVKPRDGFFGGNGVITNKNAGIYENKDAEKPVVTFEKPTVDVEPVKPEVTVPDSSAYLGAYYAQNVPADAIQFGATVKIGGYDIDFSKATDPAKPYGLEPWQVEYVNITVETTATGNNGSFDNIEEDITYTVTVTVAPKNPGQYDDKSATATGTGMIHVFKPQLTFKDTEVYYGDVQPIYDDNLADKTWKNLEGTKDHKDADVTMLNDEPTLTLTYTPEADKIASGRINSKEDIKVKADVTMPFGSTQVMTNVNEHTTFVHQACDPACGWTEPQTPGDPAFLLHVKTCTLGIEKRGGAANESYVFDVYKDGVKYSEVTIWGNGIETLVELPVGKYTIEENTGWSWRCNADNGNPIELSAINPEDLLVCHNSSNGKIYWLNGFSAVVRNIYGKR